MARPREITLRFGATAPPLALQAVRHGISVTGLEGYQRDADALTRLYVRGILSETEVDAGRTRLTRQIAGDLDG